MRILGRVLGRSLASVLSDSRKGYWKGDFTWGWQKCFLVRGESLKVGAAFACTFLRVVPPHPDCPCPVQPKSIFMNPPPCTGIRTRKQLQDLSLGGTAPEKMPDLRSDSPCQEASFVRRTSSEQTQDKDKQG